MNKANNMNRYLALATIAVAVCTAACHKNHEESGATLERIDVATPEVDSVTLYKTYPGILRANREVQLVARVNGYLESKDINQEISCLKEPCFLQSNRAIIAMP